MANEFDFRFERVPARDESEGWDGFTIPARPESWRVKLPHQCDDWDIARDGATRVQAIEDLEKFIGEAQELLARLREAS